MLLIDLYAGVAKLVDAPDLGSGAFGRVGSSPITRTKKVPYITIIYTDISDLGRKLDRKRLYWQLIRFKY